MNPSLLDAPNHDEERSLRPERWVAATRSLFSLGASCMFLYLVRHVAREIRSSLRGRQAQRHFTSPAREARVGLANVDRLVPKLLFPPPSRRVAGWRPEVY